MKDMIIKHESVGITSTKKGYYPTISVTDKSIPELADKEVGDTCTLCIQVKVTGISADNSGKRITCEVVKGEYVDDQEEKDEEDTEDDE
jgi:hypothetical protein